MVPSVFIDQADTVVVAYRQLDPDWQQVAA